MNNPKKSAAKKSTKPPTKKPITIFTKKPCRSPVDSRKMTPAENKARITKALKMRHSGATWDEVAAACQWTSRSAAYMMVTRELRRRHTELVESLDAVREEENSRIQALIKSASDVLEQTEDAELLLKAIDRLNRLMERRAKLLGLDAVQKVSVDGGIRIELVGVDVEALK